MSLERIVSGIAESLALFAVSAAVIYGILSWRRKPKLIAIDEKPMFMHGTLTTYEER